MTMKKYNYDKYNPAKIYGNWVLDDTAKYQKNYEFDMGKGEHATWNNEADAFKHTFMQAQLSLMFGKFVAEQLGNKHERDGNNKMGQSKSEENMDLWNNQQGREIAKEIIREYGAMQFPFSQKTKDIIAQKVMEKMKNGDLITDPKDKRRYEETKNGKPTGGAASLEAFSRQQIGAMSPEEFKKNESLIDEQMANGMIIDESGAYEKVKVEYTREDIAKMSSKEYEKNEASIMYQANTIGIPSKNELGRGQRSVYSEKHSTSSQSKDGKWVTINGNHVLIKE